MHTVALYTDAGVKDGEATWGCVAVNPRTDTQLFEAHGRMRSGLEDSTEAELKAIANALHACLSAKIIRRGERVKAISDNSRAVALVAGKASMGNKGTSASKRAKARHAAALAVIRELASRFNLILTAGGVKGHQPATSEDRKARHNRRCDDLCRIARGDSLGVPDQPFNGVSKCARQCARRRAAADQAGTGA